MTINLSKGNVINLSKETGGAGLHKVRLGLGWDERQAPAKRGLFGGHSRSAGIDLDASAILIGSGRVVDTVYFGKLRSSDGSVQHTGDNLTGAGDGDDESINVDLDRVPSGIDTIVFTVNSFQGDSFNQIENCFVRVVNTLDYDKELVRYDLREGGPHTAQIMAALRRSGTDWFFKAIGDFAEGRTVQQIQNAVLNSL